MDDRTLKELIYLARSNDPVALQYLYSYYDALVKAVMRKMKYISSMSLEAQDLLQVGLITFDKVFWSYRDDLDTTFDVYAKSCIIKKMQSPPIARSVPSFVQLNKPWNCPQKKQKET